MICFCFFFIELRDFPERVTFFYLFGGFPGGASGNKPACQCRRLKRCRFDPWIRKIPWRREWLSTPVSCLENPMDGGAWWAIVHRVSQSQIWLKWLSTAEYYLLDFSLWLNSLLQVIPFPTSLFLSMVSVVHVITRKWPWCVSGILPGSSPRHVVPCDNPSCSLEELDGWALGSLESPKIIW